MTTDEPVDYERTWHAALEDMDKHGIGSRDRAYLNLTRFVGLLGDNVLLSVPFDQTKRMLEGPLREPVAKALSDQLGQQVRVAISVDESLQAAVRDLDRPARLASELTVDRGQVRLTRRVTAGATGLLRSGHGAGSASVRSAWRSTLRFSLLPSSAHRMATITASRNVGNSPMPHMSIPPSS